MKIVEIAGHKIIVKPLSSGGFIAMPIDQLPSDPGYRFGHGFNSHEAVGDLLRKIKIDISALTK
jgi:hypothetical protein